MQAFIVGEHIARYMYLMFGKNLAPLASCRTRKDAYSGETANYAYYF